MTKYLSSEPFSINNAGNKAYANGWDAVFAKRPAIRVRTADITEAYIAFMNAVEGGDHQVIKRCVEDLADAADKLFYEMK